MSISDVQEFQISAEHVLGDVMYIIFKYVDSETLSNIAEVCMSWREEAWREKVKRLCIQQLWLPYKFGNLGSMLDLKPCASLLFYEGPLYPQPIKRTLFEGILENSMKEIPNTVIALRADAILTVEDSDWKVDLTGGKRDVLGLFLSNVEERVHVQLVCLPPIAKIADKLPGSKQFYDAVTNDVIARLGLNDCEDHKSIYLLFENYNDWRGCSTVIFRLLHRFSKIKNMIAFGSAKIMPANCQHQSQEIRREDYCLAAMKISGPNVESWVTLIDIVLPVDDLVRKLEELKEKIKLRRRTIGLLHGRSCILKHSRCSGHSEHPAADCPRLMRILKHIFPSIPFVGLLRNRWDWDPNKQSANKLEYHLRMFEQLSVVIVSHD